MKECHHLVKNIMTICMQQNKETADTYKPKIKSPKKWILELGLYLSNKEILLSSTKHGLLSFSKNASCAFIKDGYGNWKKKY